jgi:hypothetical protein
MENKRADSPTKVVFESLRNTLVCAMVGVAGGGIAHYPQLSIFGKAWAPWVGLLLLIAGSTLVLWNVIYTYRQLRPQLDPKKAKFWMLDLPGVTLLLIFTVAIFGVAAQLNAQGLKSVALTILG